MRNLDALSAPYKKVSSAFIARQMQNARHVREPFSDRDILDLQDTFLSNGLHFIKVDDVKSGRSLITLFLRSLNYYQHIASLNTSSAPLDSSVIDLYGELMVGGYLDAGASHVLEEFLLENFYYDFMWVEASERLVTSLWAAELFRQMNNLKLDQLIPVLIVSYEKSN